MLAPTPTSSNIKDNEFVEVFKKEHNEQYYVLLKMHLSFLLDMTMEESECLSEKVKIKKWHLIFNKKLKNKPHHETCNLIEDVKCQIQQLISFLKQDNNVKAEGIFRRTGSVERQNELKTLLNQSSNINISFEGFTVHDCASVLKAFLADLHEPLTTDFHFPLYCQIADSPKLSDPVYESKMLQIIQLLLLLLPKENRDLLENIFECLHLVASNETSNRMSAENLAKVFTPHLLCPRKLTPESLLKDSQMLFGAVAFMIKRYPELFDVPSALMIDLRNHWRAAGLNESVKGVFNVTNSFDHFNLVFTLIGAAHTVFTFVDNKMTAKENEENVTDSALAELYAHIQSLPESSKKRKLVKLFNKQNGHGTPLQVVRSSAPKSNKGFGNSLKKHMFQKKISKGVKRPGFLQLKNSSSEEMLDSPHLHHKSSSRGRLFCHNFDSSSEDEDHLAKKLKSSYCTPVERPRSKSDSDISIGSSSEFSGQYLTSTPAYVVARTGDVFTPKDQDKKSMSPITRSAQQMSRAMQETMMTPRSRKPVLLLSRTNINNLAKINSTLTHLKEEDSSNSCDVFWIQDNTSKPFGKSKSVVALSVEQIPKPKMNKTDSPRTLSDTFKQYLSGRDMLTSDSPTDSMFSSRSDDFQSCASTEDVNDDDVSVSRFDKLSDSMLYILDGNVPADELCDSNGEKRLVLKPRQFDENGKPIVFETSF
ncbi:rho GTPase-activating protein 19 isoform X1 [Euwallacea similis]|uniref:rho GTPase-activating protein 19 isoform X1 n=1 Tax=Euwallacea similis TaxID=1736056 RepID=UPI003450F55A